MTGALLERPGSLFSGTDWEEGARPGRPDSGRSGSERPEPGQPGAERQDPARQDPARPGSERQGASEGTARVPHRGRVTLESLLDRTLAEARAGGSAACPACGGPMAVRGAGAAGGTAAGAGAECGACGTRLS